MKIPPFKRTTYNVSSSAGFNPAALNPIIYLDSTVGVTTVSGAVSLWANQGSLGSSANFSQSTALLRPAFNSSDSVFNNFPSIQFAAASNQVLATAGVPASYTAYDDFIVLRCVTGTPPSIAASGRDHTGNDAQAVHYPYTNATIYDSDFTTARKNYTTFTASVLATTHLYNVVSVAGEWTASMNGTAVYTTATNTAGGFGGPYSIGISGGGIAFDGKMAFRLVTNYKLSAGQRTQLKAYIATRYGITIA